MIVVKQLFENGAAPTLPVGLTDNLTTKRSLLTVLGTATFVVRSTFVCGSGSLGSAVTIYKKITPDLLCKISIGQQ